MAGRRPQQARPVAQVQAPGADGTLVRAVQALQALQAPRSRDVIQNVDLVLGTNKLPHKLGRAVAGYVITLKTADLGFGHALDESNPAPEREVWIEVVGNDAARVTIEVY